MIRVGDQYMMCVGGINIGELQEMLRTTLSHCDLLTMASLPNYMTSLNHAHYRRALRPLRYKQIRTNNFQIAFYFLVPVVLKLVV